MTLSAARQRGRENKGPPDIHPKSFSLKGPKLCSVLSIGVIGKSALEIAQFLRRNFWMISGVPAQRRKNINDHHRKKIIWGTFLASKKNFPGRWWIQKPGSRIYHRNLSSVTPIFWQRKVPHWQEMRMNSLNRDTFKPFRSHNGLLG